MTSFTLSLSGVGSELQANYHPPIELDPAYQWEAGLIDLHTYMTIPNINARSNVMLHTFSNDTVVDISDISGNIDTVLSTLKKRGNESAKGLNVCYEIIDIIELGNDGMNSVGELKVRITYLHHAKLEIGSYEITELDAHLHNVLKKCEWDAKATIKLSIDTNTLKCKLKSNRNVVFDSSRSTIGRILGFKDGTLEANKEHISDNIINITPTNVVRLETNITTGSYANDNLNRGLHEFYPSVGIGYKVVERPQTIIYLPLSERTISNFIVRLVDQNGGLIDFRGETITLRIHIRRA